MSGVHRTAVPRPTTLLLGRDAELSRAVELVRAEPVVVVCGLPGMGKSELAYAVVAEIQRSAEPFDEATLLEPGPGATALELSAALERAVVDRGRDGPGRRLVVVEDVARGDDAGGADAVWEQLADLGRRGGASRVIAVSRVEPRWPARAGAPGLVRLGPLDDVASSALAVELARRFDVAVPDDAARRSGGSPLALTRLVAHAAEDDPVVSLVRGLDADARAALALVAAMDGAARTGDVDAEVLDALARRFLITASEGALRVARPTAVALASAELDGVMTRARRDAAARHRERFTADPAARATDAVAAIRLLAAAGDAAAAWELAESARRDLAAAGHDHEILDVLAAIARELPERGAAIDLLRAEILLRWGRVASTREIVDALEARVDVSSEPRFHLVRGAVAERLGDLPAAEEAFRRARDVAENPGDRYRAALELADVTSMRDARDEPEILAAADEAGELSRRDKIHLDWSRALHHLVGERFDQVLRALASGAGGDAPLARRASEVQILEIIARVESDDVAGARACFDRAVAPARRAGILTDETAGLARGIILCAAGQLVPARAELRSAFARFGRHGDRLAASVAGHYLSLALFGLGDFDGAADTLAEITATAEAAGMETLALRGRAMHASVVLASGRVDRARERLAALLATGEMSPNARAIAGRALAVAEALGGDLAAARAHLDADGAGESGAHPPAVAATELVRAEIELMGGDPAVALEHARSSRRYYNACGRAWMEARAATAEAAAYLAGDGEADRVGAERALSRARTLARENRYDPIAMQCTLLDAARARRVGDDIAAREALLAGLRRARTVGGRRIEVQAQRAALGAAGGPTMPGVLALLRTIGLDAGPRHRIRDRAGERLATEADLERERERRDLLVDVAAGVILVGGGREAIRGRPTATALLARLIDAGAGEVDAETLYCDVWSADEYHPLKHRNTLYVTINRTRRALADVFGDRTVIETVPGGWRIADGISACTVRPA